jgi:hypothetical protein
MGGGGGQGDQNAKGARVGAVAAYGMAGKKLELHLPQWTAEKAWGKARSETPSAGGIRSRGIDRRPTTPLSRADRNLDWRLTCLQIAQATVSRSHR